LRLDYAEYSEDGSITIFGDKDGYPRFTGVIPAPDINTKTPEIRLKRQEAACNNLILRGYYITSKRLIRNSAFDRPDQKTTETRMVKEQIVELLPQINKECII